MCRKCEDYNNDEVCQEWPKYGKLKKNMNKTLSDLKKVLKDKDGLIYVYVLTTVETIQGDFVQTGSAPNFQGGYITLCICKHRMRTWRKPDDWKDIWIAGFTGVNILNDHRNYLFYLMRVQKAFQSHKELWDWLPSYVRTAKDASRHKCGDIYRPISNLKDKFNPIHYSEPIKNHVHFKNNEWYNDINYKTKVGKRPALLVGVPEYSFLWSQPKIYFNKKLPRTKKWNDINEFIKSLRSK